MSCGPISTMESTIQFEYYCITVTLTLLDEVGTLGRTESSAVHSENTCELLYNGITVLRGRGSM
ncbi:hypothetical protein SAMN05421642_11532 [Rhodococcoides kyotonense]|uniref:Uncharacterized protein n=1 Tax=Rhodococcoides kyotonense TaxID=398843 RepID=A0A239LYI0_9NOCA|nr:hypothetical protein SAMN05421642_11532 [Rhodococcus kyotonensis]